MVCGMSTHARQKKTQYVVLLRSVIAKACPMSSFPCISRGVVLTSLDIRGYSFALMHSWWCKCDVKMSLLALQSSQEYQLQVQWHSFSKRTQHLAAKSPEVPTLQNTHWQWHHNAVVWAAALPILKGPSWACNIRFLIWTLFLQKQSIAIVGSLV